MAMVMLTTHREIWMTEFVMGCSIVYTTLTILSFCCWLVVSLLCPSPSSSNRFDSLSFFSLALSCCYSSCFIMLSSSVFVIFFLLSLWMMVDAANVAVYSDLSCANYLGTDTGLSNNGQCSLGTGSSGSSFMYTLLCSAQNAANLTEYSSTTSCSTPVFTASGPGDGNTCIITTSNGVQVASVKISCNAASPHYLATLYPYLAMILVVSLSLITW